MEEPRGADSTGSGQPNHFNSTNNSYCTDLSTEDIYGLKVTYYCVSSTAAVACILAIILILVSKRHKKFVYRLTLYLMVATLLVEVVNILGVAPVYHNGTTVVVREGFEGLCIAAGFLYQVAFWMELLVIFWIVLYLLMILVFRCNVTGTKQEACGLTVVLILPFLFNWIPFVKDMYGLSGPHCWIKQSMNSNCEYDNVGIALMFSLLNGPEFFTISVVLVSLVAIAIVMCRKVMKQQPRVGQPSIHQQGLKEVLPLLLYLIIHFVLWAAGVVLRICDAILSAQDKTPPHSVLLVLHHMVINARLLLIPLICLLHLSMSFCRRKQNKQHALNTTTCYIVPNEFTDQEDDPLIIKGSSEAISSKEYKSIFEGTEQ